jgi:hypothetical protein
MLWREVRVMVLSLQSLCGILPQLCQQGYHGLFQRRQIVLYGLPDHP